MDSSNVDPELLPALSALKQLWGDTAMDLSDLAAARQTLDAMSAQKNSMAPVIDGVQSSRQVIHNEQMDLDVVVYVHKPTAPSATVRSALLHFHGGGFVTGSATHNESQLRQMVKRFNCVVVSVDYRLAPEHPFPAALYDGFTALQWLHSSNEILNIDPQKIVVFAESAGAGLAAGLSLYARDHSDIEIAQQILLYPMLDHRNVAAPTATLEDTVIWSRENNQFAWSAYLGKGVDDSVLAYASPSCAHDLKGLPPSYVCVGDIDLYYGESIDFVEKLGAAQVSAKLDVYPGAYHAFQVSMPDAAVSQQCLQKLDDVLTQALA